MFENYRCRTSNEPSDSMSFTVKLLPTCYGSEKGYAMAESRGGSRERGRKCAVYEMQKCILSDKNNMRAIMQEFTKTLRC